MAGYRAQQWSKASGHLGEDKAGQVKGPAVQDDVRVHSMCFVDPLRHQVMLSSALLVDI